MPLNIAALTANRASAQIDFGPAAGALAVEYYPARLTSAMLLRLADAGRLKDLPPEQALGVMTSASALLATLLASWDLTETDPESGEERVMPIDQAHLDALPLSVQWSILNGVLSTQGGAASGEAVAPEPGAGSVSAPSSSAS